MSSGFMFCSCQADIQSKRQKLMLLQGPTSTVKPQTLFLFILVYEFLPLDLSKLTIAVLISSKATVLIDE